MGFQWSDHLSRRDSPSIGFNEAHDKLIPERLSGKWGRLAASQLRDVPSIAFRLSDGRAYTYDRATGEIASSTPFRLRRH